MAERGSHGDAERKASGGQALVQIGHYVLGETLGIGTFGKVKGKSLDIICQMNSVIGDYILPSGQKL